MDNSYPEWAHARLNKLLRECGKGRPINHAEYAAHAREVVQHLSRVKTGGNA